MILIDYLIFLLSPEDSSDRPIEPGRNQKMARFDNRFHGAVKIFFWIGVTVGFWIGLLLFLQRISAVVFSHQPPL